MTNPEPYRRVEVSAKAVQARHRRPDDESQTVSPLPALLHESSSRCLAMQNLRRS
jgi:hypothetical protein